MSYCSRSRRRRFTTLDFKIWAYNCIYGHFQQRFTAHAQKRLFTNFRYKFRHHCSILRRRFSYRVRNFRDLTFSVDFCILYADNPSYFYFHISTDLESILHGSAPTAIISTKFEVDKTIYCVLAADTLRDLVTFDLLTLNSCHTWRVTWPTMPSSFKTLRLFVHELWVKRLQLVTINKKLSYRRGTARCVVSIEILPIATQQCRNYLYYKSWPMVWSWRFSRRQCVIDNVHSTMTRSSRLPLSQVS